MAAGITTIYQDEVDAAYAADSMAERAAENQRDFDERESLKLEEVQEYPDYVLSLGPRGGLKMERV